MVLHFFAVIAPVQMPNLRKVLCYAVQFSVVCPRLPHIDYLPEREQTMLRFQGDTVTINHTHLQKLVSNNFSSSIPSIRGCRHFT